MANIIEIIINAEDNASTKLDKFLDTLAGAAIVAGIAKLGELGAQADAVEARFVALAGSSAEAETILAKITTTTGGTIDKMTAMQAASRFLSMGLASTADESSKLINMALRLGDQTADAGSRIENFSLLLANTSIPRLDSFGISASTVRTRIKELQTANEGMSREMAFMTAVMEEGAVAMDTLGDAGLSATQDIDMAKASITNLKIEVGQLLAPLVQTGAEGFGTLASNISELIDKTKRANAEFGFLPAATALVVEGLFDVNDTMDTAIDKIEAMDSGLEQYRFEMFDAGQMAASSAEFVDQYNVAIAASEAAVTAAATEQKILSERTGNSAESFDQYTAAIASAEDAAASATQAQVDLANEILEAEAAALAAESAFLDSAAALGKMNEEQFAESQIQALRDAGLEGEAFVEAQDKILTRFGLLTEEERTARAAIDDLTQELVDGEISAGEYAEGIEDARLNLIELTGGMREAEAAANAAKSAFLDSAAALDEMSEKQFAQAQIESLREAGLEGEAFVEAQNKILQRFGLLTEEEIATQSAIADLTQELIAGEIGAHAYAIGIENARLDLLSGAAATDLATERTAEYSASLQDAALESVALGIAIEDSAKPAVEDLAPPMDAATEKAVLLGSGFGDAASDAAVLSSEVIAVGDAVNALPESKQIDIRVNINRTVTEIARGGGLTEEEARGIIGGGAMANGTQGSIFNRPTNILVGDQGSERVTVEPSSNVTNNFNMTVNTAATAPSVMQDFSMMQSFVGQ